MKLFFIRGSLSKRIQLLSEKKYEAEDSTIFIRGVVSQMINLFTEEAL